MQLDCLLRDCLMPLEYIYKILCKNDDKEYLKYRIPSELGIENEFYKKIEEYYDLLKEYNYNSLIYLQSTGNYEGVIPDNILELISQHDVLVIDYYYNVTLDNLPNNVKLINIGTINYYKHALNNLPTNLEHLIFKTGYYELLDYLPIALKTLIITGYCNMPLHNLPPSLKVLSVGGRYNQPFINLPAGLESLTLSEFYQVELQSLPHNLKELYIGSDYYLPLVSLPDSIETLTISGSVGYIDKFPISLKKLNICYEACFYGTLNDSVEEISVGSFSRNVLYNLLEEHMPNNLKRILLNPMRTYDFTSEQYQISDSENSILDDIRKTYPNYEVRFV